MRPKGTASQPPPRAPFEIPPSLQQFSAISRSLATAVTNGRPIGSGSVTHGNMTSGLVAEQAPSCLSKVNIATPTTTSPSAPRTAGQKIPQKRSFSEIATVSAPQQISSANKSKREGSSSHKCRLKHGMDSRATVPAEEARGDTASAIPDHAASESNPSREPPLKDGETPSLATHPQLIARMIARKLAEAEKNGDRERWAQRQQLHRMSLPPAEKKSLPETIHPASDVGVKSPSLNSGTKTPELAPIAATPPLKMPTSVSFDHRVHMKQNSPAMPPAQDQSGISFADIKGLKPTTDSGPRTELVQNVQQFEPKSPSNLKGTAAASTLVSKVSVARSGVSQTPTSTSTAVDERRRKTAAVAPDIPPLFSEKPPHRDGQSKMSPSEPSDSRSTASVRVSVSSSDLPPQNQIQANSWPQQHDFPQNVSPQLLPPGPPPVSLPIYYENASYQGWPDSASELAAPPTSSGAPMRSEYGSIYASAPGLGSHGYKYSVNPYALAQTRHPPHLGSLFALTGSFGTNTPKPIGRKQPYLIDSLPLEGQAAAGMNVKFMHANQGQFTVPKR
jgi:hypothetical protein